MPTYEYHCLKCEKDFEVNQSIKDEPLQRCILDGCNGEVRRRIGTGAGIIFKGSGFYQTDYKKNGSSFSESKKESCPMAGSEGSKCDSCPAAKE